MRPIFISYRRDDSEGQAGRLFQDLRDEFGAENVFMDVATIEPGVDFRRAIEKNTADCGVLLAVIGRNWLTVVDANGRRRLDDPNDFVRLETALALRRDIPVVPVLVQGARMPRAEELPDDLKDLSFRNSVELTHARWDSDVKLLIEALRKLLERATQTRGSEPAPPAPQPPGRVQARWAVPAIVAVALVAAVGGWALLRSAPTPAPRPAEVASSSESRPAAGGATDDEAARQRKVREEAARSEEAARLAAAQEAARKEAARREAARQEAARKDAAREEAVRKEEAARQEAARLEEARQEAARQEAARQEAARRDAAAREAQAARQSQIRAHNEGVCISGYVWREARPGDKVCVTPDVRARTFAENQAAASTRSPTGGAYGPNTCKQGYVWREAFPNDVVCVVPSSRQQAANDNAQAARRVVPLPP